MDLIKMISTSEPTELVSGEAIVGYDSALWVERFQAPGEFKIEAKLSSGLLDFLPIETFVSHVRTRELMVVENHVVKEPKAEDPTIEISGRSFLSYLENRIVAQNYVADGGNEIYVYNLAADNSWEQIRFFIQDHIDTLAAGTPDDMIPFTTVTHSCTGTGHSEERNYKYGTVLDRVLEQLKIDDVGIRVLRPDNTTPDIDFNIYQGVDRTQDVRFSTSVGDLDNVQYLFTNKRYYNTFRVVGRWVQVFGYTDITPKTNLERRTMIIQASDIDEQYGAMPTGTDLTDVIYFMGQRGAQALIAQKRLTIVNADISPNARLRYKVDYNLGDLVMIDANFNQQQVMRVVEFAEIEDETGVSGQPTLEVPGVT